VYNNVIKPGRINMVQGRPIIAWRLEISLLVPN